MWPRDRCARYASAPAWAGSKRGSPLAPARRRGQLGVALRTAPRQKAWFLPIVYWRWLASANVRTSLRPSPRQKAWFLPLSAWGWCSGTLARSHRCTSPLAPARLRGQLGLHYGPPRVGLVLRHAGAESPLHFGLARGVGQEL